MSSRPTPGSSAVTRTLLSPSHRLTGGNSRVTAAPSPEKIRFISLCMRRSSAKGSNPYGANPRSGMEGPPLIIDPCGAEWRFPPGEAPGGPVRGPGLLPIGTGLDLGGVQAVFKRFGIYNQYAISLSMRYKSECQNPSRRRRRIAFPDD